MRAILAASWLSLVGVSCFHPSVPADEPCSSSGACPDGQRCDLNASPPTCVIGTVAGDAAIDARVWLDAPADAPPLTPSVSGFGFAHTSNEASLDYTFDTPAASNLLLVTAETGHGSCDEAPTVTSISYANVTLSPIAQILGVPLCATDTRSEVWALISPPLGSAQVSVVLSGSDGTVHSTAIAFENANLLQPVRNTATALGMAATPRCRSRAPRVISSSASWVRATSIANAGPGSNLLFIDDVTPATSLDNTAASTLPGAASATADWSFGGSDLWQEILVSLRP